MVVDKRTNIKKIIIRTFRISDHLSSPYQTLYGFQVLAVPKSSLEAHFQHQILSSSKQFDFLGYNYKEVIENERY